MEYLAIKKYIHYYNTAFPVKKDGNLISSFLATLSYSTREKHIFILTNFDKKGNKKEVVD